MKSKIAVVLLSGGLDSTTTTVFAKKEGYDIHALTFYYGQKLSKEIQCAQTITKKLDINHQIIDISSFKNAAQYSALTHPESFEVPKGRSADEMTEKIPITYVPMRNTFLIVFAAAYLESIILNKIEVEQINPNDIEARIFIAANNLDYSGYPDCRPEFFEKINELLLLSSKVGTEYGVEMKVETPLLYLGKKEICELGTKLDAPLELTWSCYEGGEIPCRQCDSCLLREKGFAEAGLEDPLISRLKKEGKM